MSRLPDEMIENAIGAYKECVTTILKDFDLWPYETELHDAMLDLLEELKEFRKTGLTPEQIFAMDEEYKKMSKELGGYKQKLENVERFLDGCKL